MINFRSLIENVTDTLNLINRSPERVEGNAYTYSSDLWSIGISIFEMATGKHPYPETNNPILLYEMIRYQPSPSLAGFSGMSLEIVDFVNIW